MKIHELTESRPTKTKDEIDWDTIFDEPVSKGELEPTKPAATGTGPKAQKAPPLRQATAAGTKSAMRGVTMSPDAAQKLSSLNIPDDALAAEPDIEVPGYHAVDVPGEVRPVTADNLPSVIRTEIARINREVGEPEGINPEWHQVKNLPGYMSKPIRVLGRAVFKPYTNTPIEDISVVANLGGQGPNTNREVDGVAAWLATNATEIDRTTMDFDATMPGYEAHTILYEISGMRFLIVIDFAGKYIYGWPDQDSVKQVGSQNQIKQIGNR